MNTITPTSVPRRRILKTALGAAAAMAWPLRLLAKDSPAADVITRTIPASGEAVPVSGLGTARTFDIGPGNDAAMAQRIAVLRAFVDGGGRLADSSPMYGNAEAVLGQAAAALGVTGQLFFATKVWTRGAEAGREQMRRSAERLGVAKVDLMQVHNLVDLRTQLETLRAWKAEGRIRYLGVTHYTAGYHDELADLVESEPLDFVQFNYSLMERNAEQRLLPACADHGVAVVVNEPFEKGNLFDAVGDAPLPAIAGELGCDSWAQMFLKFIIGHPAVTTVIPATGDPGHATENAAAGRGVAPNKRQRQQILDAFNKVA